MSVWNQTLKIRRVYKSPTTVFVHFSCAGQGERRRNLSSRTFRNLPCNEQGREDIFLICHIGIGIIVEVEKSPVGVQGGKIILSQTSGKLSKISIIYTGPSGMRKVFRNNYGEGRKVISAMALILRLGRLLGESPEGLNQ